MFSKYKYQFLVLNRLFSYLVSVCLCFHFYHLCSMTTNQDVTSLLTRKTKPNTKLYVVRPALAFVWTELTFSSYRNSSRDVWLRIYKKFFRNYCGILKKNILFYFYFGTWWFNCQTTFIGHRTVACTWQLLFLKKTNITDSYILFRRYLT